MAMSLFDSESDTSAGSMKLVYSSNTPIPTRTETTRPKKGRLLPFLIMSDVPRLELPRNTMALTPTLDESWTKLEPHRKGKARMSQEKRRRLARRREREALLLALEGPNLVAIAPLHPAYANNCVSYAFAIVVQ
jgi:hypothetical protein